MQKSYTKKTVPNRATGRTTQVQMPMETQERVQDQPVREKREGQFNVSAPVEYEKNGETQTYWQNLGTAFQTKSGIMVHLNALPKDGKLFINQT